MKKAMKNAVGCIVTICLIVVSLRYLSELLQRKDSDEKYQPFFEQEENFDVLFLGSSHMMDAVFPMELWNDYGIISYNFGGIGNRIPTSYWLMRNALDYTSPELVVVDCFLLRRTAKVSDNFGEVHQSMDVFPLSDTKIAAALDLAEESEHDEYTAADRSAMELIWDFSVYHNRWNEISEGNYTFHPTVEKGAQSQIAVGVPNQVPDVPREDMLIEDTVGVDYLRKIIEECQGRDIEVLLVYLPFPASEEEQREANRVYEIAEEYGVNYLNFLDMDVVNYETDCCDADSHLNVSGARKVTDYIGAYIVENYGIVDRRGDAAYSAWYEDYEQYEAFELENLTGQQMPDNYLMLLADPDYHIILEFCNWDILQEEKYVCLLENLGIESEKLGEGHDFAVVYAGGEEVYYLEDAGKNGGQCELSGETVSVFVDVDGAYGTAGTYGVYLNGQEFYTVIPGEDENTDIRMVVLDAETMQVIEQIELDWKNISDIQLNRIQ